MHEEWSRAHHRRLFRNLQRSLNMDGLERGHAGSGSRGAVGAPLFSNSMSMTGSIIFGD